MKNAVGTVESVLLLGGRSDIGRAIVHRLVTDGARRVVLAVRGGAADPAHERELRAAGATFVTTVAFDVHEPATHRAVIDAVFDDLGDVDVVVDAVGILGDQAEYEHDVAAAADSIVVNLGGHVSAGLAVAERLRRQGHGTLVVISSVAGVRVRRANFVYGAAKAGLDGFAQGLGDSLAGSGARVMVVRPGFVRSTMTAGQQPAPFAVDPSVVADAVADGLRLSRQTVWVPRLLGPAFGVLRMLPRPVWRKMPR